MSKHFEGAAAQAAVAKQRIYLRPPVSYYGGKQTMLKDILPLIPPHSKYCEPFLGGGAVFWAKQPSPVEVINDLDSFVSNFYRVMKADLPVLRAMVDATVFGRECHDEAATIRQRPAYFTPVQRAWAFFVLANMGMFSSLDTPCVTPSADSKRSQAFYRKAGLLDDDAYGERFKNVFVEQRDALYVIQKNDSADTFFFVDPPYFQANMGHYAGYTRDDFGRLLDVLAGVKGRFILTTYPSELLDEYVSRLGWRSIELDLQLAAGAKGKRKTEVITRNF